MRFDKSYFPSYQKRREGMMEVLMPISIESSDHHTCKPHIEKVSGEHVGLDHKGQQARTQL